jgi:hypothetical protein
MVVYFFTSFFSEYINCTKGFHCDISIYAYNMYFDQIHPLYSSFLFPLLSFWYSVNVDEDKFPEAWLPWQVHINKFVMPVPDLPGSHLALPPESPLCVSTNPSGTHWCLCCSSQICYHSFFNQPINSSQVWRR